MGWKAEYEINAIMRDLELAEYVNEKNILKVLISKGSNEYTCQKCGLRSITVLSTVYGL